MPRFSDFLIEDDVTRLFEMQQKMNNHFSSDFPPSNSNFPPEEIFR